MNGLRHKNGAALVRIYGPAHMQARGGTVAFNVLRPDGSTLPYQVVEEAARARRVAIRGGCFCNPGAAEHAFKFANHDIVSCLDQLGGNFSIHRLQERLGPQATVGALRASVGVPTNIHDVDRAIDCIGELMTNKCPSQHFPAT